MKYLILGGGPAGLTFANKLKQAGETSFLVLELETVAGGLCRSVEVDGSPFDIGGGHFLDVCRPHVNEFLFQFMPENEWDKYDRKSLIVIGNNTINHPIEANIWQMTIDDQVEYLKSISMAGCNQGTPMPQEFVDWIFWKLGDKLANDYMIPYNKKIFADDLNGLGTYWLDKLPNVSFDDTLRSCLMKRAYGKQPGHAQFYYPKKYGYGELWRRMAEELGKQIEYDKRVTQINFKKKEVRTSDGEKYSADIIVTTIPWLEFDDMVGMPEEIFASVAELKYSTVETRYYQENIDTKAQWIYYPDPKLAYHRILVRHNFCQGSRGYWTETRVQRKGMLLKEEREKFHYINKYAYPLNMLHKPKIMNRLLGWGAEKDIYGLGRWGEHQHYNSDLTVDLAMKRALSFIW